MTPSTGEILTAGYIADRWPRLFHVAEAGSWPSIQAHGLLSTSALLDLFEVSGPAREQVESRRRPESVTVQHPVHGTAVIRDNKPITETVLRRTLEGMTDAQWYRTLNGRVFFWLSETRLSRLRTAAAYRDHTHDILVLSTEKLLSAHGARVELSPMNSGAVHPGAKNRRGVGTFQPIPDYPWAQRRRINPSEPIVELTVPSSVPDITDLVIDVREGQ